MSRRETLLLLRLLQCGFVRLESTVQIYSSGGVSKEKSYRQVANCDCRLNRFLTGISKILCKYSLGYDDKIRIPRYASNLKLKAACAVAYCCGEFFVMKFEPIII